jgi:hypothetical protein
MQRNLHEREATWLITNLTFIVILVCYVPACFMAATFAGKSQLNLPHSHTNFLFRCFSPTCFTITPVLKTNFKVLFPNPHMNKSSRHETKKRQNHCMCLLNICALACSYFSTLSVLLGGIHHERRHWLMPFAPSNFVFTFYFAISLNLSNFFRIFPLRSFYYITCYKK